MTGLSGGSFKSPAGGLNSVWKMTAGESSESGIACGKSSWTFKMPKTMAQYPKTESVDSIALKIMDPYILPVPSHCGMLALWRFRLILDIPSKTKVDTGDHDINHSSDVFGT